MAIHSPAMTRNMVIYPSYSITCDTAPVWGGLLNPAPPPRYYPPHPPCDATHWCRFPCLLWMGGPLAVPSSSGASPTSSEWRPAPFHLPPVAGAHLLAPTSSLCRAPTSSGGDPSLVRYPLLVISAIEAFLEPILVRSVVRVWYYLSH